MSKSKDDFTRFFSDDGNAMLELKLSAPPDRPTLNEDLLRSQIAKSSTSGEDFLKPDNDSYWTLGQFYCVNKTLDHTCTKEGAAGGTTSSIPFG